MSTANESRNSTMTSEAYDCLDCFVSGLDEVIYEIAESIADRKGQRDPNGVVEITQEEVREAAQIVFNAIKDHAGKSVPDGLVKQIEEMRDCVLEKCQIPQTEK